ncbi:MAG TPA: hypothetical protein PLR25_08550 [Planctomycetaceae bacterium]|nr:hypothetical protein [Planctomycetaceae bacterium]
MAETNRPVERDHNSDSTLVEAVRQGHESSTLAVRAVAVTGVAIFLVAVCALGIVAMVMKSKPKLPADILSASEQWKRDVTDPGVQLNQAVERRQLAEKNDQRLNSYGWENDDHSTARIPIDRAMEIMADRKLEVAWPASEKEATP